MEIIAEIGQNHNGDMKLAKKLITKAKLMGADTVKFQVYNAKKLFQKKIWFDDNCKIELILNKLKSCLRSAKKNIEFMASVFDEEKVEWLENGVRRYKIASRSIFENDLIKKLLNKKTTNCFLRFGKKLCQFLNHQKLLFYIVFQSIQQN